MHKVPAGNDCLLRKAEVKTAHWIDRNIAEFRCIPGTTGVLSKEVAINTIVTEHM